MKKLLYLALICLSASAWAETLTLKGVIYALDNEDKIEYPLSMTMSFI